MPFIWKMMSITSKELHEQTGAVLDRVKQGQRFRVLRGGEPDAFSVPTNDQVDPSWDEIMANARKARAQVKLLRPNPILMFENTAVGTQTPRQRVARCA